ncbi:hypothetical protein B0I35DRAFT_501248 [Stachybotrys elegans]|uniref:DUF726 domain-containing protein n=1 Tax=Stachybotrys elegans TaxID=80388 RepID=A0A8K0SSC9_9HYPO|nr:hypothetical protein B0I35DRAFT_501248 [Stachybotrys elegans]
MGRVGRGGGQGSSRRTVDLTGAISIAEKNDLITLVNAITERLHNNISNIFDSPPISPIIGGNENHQWLSLPLLHRKDRSQDKENESPLSSQTGKPSIGDGSKSFHKAHGIIEKEEKEAMTPQLQELKKEAVTFYQKWQTMLLNRLREVAVQEPAAQPPTRGRGRGCRGNARGRGGGRGGKVNPITLTLATGPPRSPPNHVDRELADRYPPMPNPLWKLEHNKRRLLQHTVFLLVLSMQDYTAYSRLLLINLTSSLNLSLETFQQDEVRLARGLAQAALDALPEEPEDQKTEEVKATKKWKISVGNALGSKKPYILAPPLKAVGVGTERGGLGLSSSTAASALGAIGEHGLLTGCLFGMNTQRPMGKIMEGFAREIQDFAFMPLLGNTCIEYMDPAQTLAEHRRLRLVIAISGWITKNCDESQPWRCLGSQAEVYAVRWETAALLNLGTSLQTVIKSISWKNAKEEIFSRTIFTSLIEAVWPVSLLKISKLIDNPWSLGMVRAEKAGIVLADAIMRSKFQGDRPVSLIGYSLAARAIYTCLMVLAERRQFGVIDSVVMMGTPAPSESRVWLTLKSVVAGRLVNVYSEHDYILGFLFRTSNIQFGIAGLQEIQGADGVENHCVKRMESGHLGYQEMVGNILQEIGWEDLNNSACGGAKTKEVDKC